MGMNWTSEQKKVIDARNRNVLVSAAAGSGKTAVLVERIISIILDKENPVDIDRLLIVTFTKAAASEMRERIGAALEARLQEDPENQHLQRQTTLLHHAQISTIDGFCSFVIRNYFHMIDLDPGFRMADEGELKLLKADVLEEVLEAEYAGKKDGFLNFVESYSTGKTDEGIGELVLRLYDYASSAPWPNQWLEECRKKCMLSCRLRESDRVQDAAYTEGDTKETDAMQAWAIVENSDWMKYLWKDICCILQEVKELTEENHRLAQDMAGPYMYLPMLDEDAAGISYMLEAENYRELYERIRVISWAKLSSKKDPGVDPILRETVKENRNRVKDLVNDLKKQYFFASPEQILKTIQRCEKPISALIDLTQHFSDAFASKKREKNLLDFPDLEHLALDILIKKKRRAPEPDNEEWHVSDKTEGDSEPEEYFELTEAALELSGRFHEILIDEYQDSNMVQEIILNAVAGNLPYKKTERDVHADNRGGIQGKYNVFMVGDVKQSIYRFRLAKPELFMEKLDSYTIEESKTQRIGLHKNFRSRSEVLRSVNFFFQQIMRRELGGVEYDRDAALYTGASFESGNNPAFASAEVLALELDGDDLMETDEKKNMQDRELEARLVGKRIREIVGKELVWDNKLKKYRPACYRDCVILLRTMAGWSEVFGQVLNSLGIPAYSTSKTGYFSAQEVQTVLNFLKICDNPMQEIPYTSVLTSAFVGCTPEDLARIKCISPEEPIYICAGLYAENGDFKPLREKLNQFLIFYEDVCERVTYTPIHELIWYLVQTSGFGDYVAALPYGEQRIANVRMLVEKAVDYEATSYGGLFHFIRYMEHLQKYDVDFGEVNIVGENDDTVRIMSIHKSKGLEFPIVFVSGMSKRFNQQDLNGPILMDADFGVASVFVDYERRVKCPTLMRSVLRQKLLKENLGEELRVLYVAMTRAKEKLILTGTITDIDKKLQSYDYLKCREEAKLPYSTLVNAGNYWGWILPALIRAEGRAPIALLRFSPADLVADEAKVQSRRLLRREELLHWNLEQVYEPKVEKMLRERFFYVYPYGSQRDIPVKVSVSELKKHSIADEEAYEPYHEPDVVPLVPQFMQEEEKELEGAGRGTAYHALMERLNLSDCESEQAVESQILHAVENHHLTGPERECICISDFVKFAASPIGKRMAEAQKRGNLYREQPFVLGISAQKMKERWDADETILVQGIIDAYFYEKDEIILVDYKTDRIGPVGAAELVRKYKVQLDNYAEALERLTHRKVKEKIIYSFSLGRELLVETQDHEQLSFDFK